MKRELYYVNNQHKLMKKWRAGEWRMICSITLDIVLLAAIFAILFLLNDSGVANLYLGGTNLGIVLGLGITYIVLSLVKGAIEFRRYQNLDFTVIVKEQDNITILRSLIWIDKESLMQNIDKILDEKNIVEYEYTDYNNCKLVKETKTYYEYIGEKNGVSSRFKIYKVYFNIKRLNKEEN